MRAILFLCTALLFASCNNNQNVSQVRYHDDGMRKPVIALLDVVDSTEANMPWALSDEFTSEITSRIKKLDKLFLIRQDEISWQYPLQQDITSLLDHSWLKENRPNAGFITFVELIEHDIVARNPEKNTDEKNSSSYDLKLSARIKVVDMREDAPKVILQEIVTQSTYIPSQLATIDYTSTRWGKTMFLVTPVGLAHSKLEKAIVKRIEDYVLLAKSR